MGVSSNAHGGFAPYCPSPSFATTLQHAHVALLSTSLESLGLPIPSPPGLTPLHMAARYMHTWCCCLVLPKNAYLEPLWLPQPCSLRDTPTPGFTPLHMAAGYMHTGSMTVLLEAGANPEIKVGRGFGVGAQVERVPYQGVRCGHLEAAEATARPRAVRCARAHRSLYGCSGLCRTLLVAPKLWAAAPPVATCPTRLASVRPACPAQDSFFSNVLLPPPIDGIGILRGFLHRKPLPYSPFPQDNNGRDVVTLIDNLRASMPLSLASVQRRLALEEVGNCLTDRCACMKRGVG